MGNFIGRFITCAALAISMCSPTGAAPRLVLDVNAAPVAINSNPIDFTDLGARSFFDADDGVSGHEPWSTDGTTQGTFAWGDVFPGASGATQRHPTLVGTKAFLVGYDVSSGPHLWVSAGTRETTREIVNDDFLAHASWTTPLGALGDKFAFLADDPDGSGRELWLSDGTAAGTVRADAASGERYFVSSSVLVSSKFYFLSRNASGEIEPWVSDGTPLGTRRLTAIPNVTTQGTWSPSLAHVGNFVLFAAPTADLGIELWRIDIRDNSVSLVKDIASASSSGLESFTVFGVVNGAAIFTASASGDDQRTLWRSDGTAAGTYAIGSSHLAIYGYQEMWLSGDGKRMLFNVQTSTAPELWSTDGSGPGTFRLRATLPSGIVVAGNKFYVLEQKTAWVSDGTLPGTSALNFAPQSSEEIRDAAASSDALYVRGSIGFSCHVYRYDIASATTQTIMSCRLGGGVFSFAQGQLYFDHCTDELGCELWISNGTIAGTRVLKNLAPEIQTAPSDPADLTRLGDAVFFSADDGIHGREMWRSDGTAEGTQLLVDVNLGSEGSSPSNVFVAGNSLYFFAKKGSRYSFWRFDGTTEETVELSEISPRPYGPDHCDSRGITYDDHVFFTAYDDSSQLQVWRTDGTPANTIPVTRIPQSGLGFDSFCYLTETNGEIYFSSGRALWRLSDNEDGVELVSETMSTMTSSSPRQLIELNDKLFFVADDVDSRPQLWISNGTGAGTKTVGLPTSSSIKVLGKVGGSLLALLSPVNSAYGVWAVDESGARELFTNVSLYGDEFLVNDNLAFFSGLVVGQNRNDVEPWISDGTTIGTMSVADTDPSRSGYPRFFTNYGGVTYFEVSSPKLAVWRSDGTAEGTRVVAEGTLGVSRLGTSRHLFIVTNDGSTGSELYALDNARPVAIEDALPSVEAGKSVSIVVTENDVDADGKLNVATVRVIDAPSGGVAVADTMGKITYTASRSFVGADRFTYVVSDDQGYVSAPTSVRATVTAPPLQNVPSTPNSPSPGGKSGGGGGSTSVPLLVLLLAVLWLRKQNRKFTRWSVHLAP